MVHVSEALQLQFWKYTGTAMMRFAVFVAATPTFFKNVWNFPMSSTSTLIKSVEYYFLKDYFNTQVWRQDEERREVKPEYIGRSPACLGASKRQTHSDWPGLGQI